MMGASRTFIAGILLCMALWTPCLQGGFVQRSGHQLSLDGKPWYFIGTDAYWLMDEAKYSDKRGSVDAFFSKCTEYNLRVVRIWGFNHNSPSAWGVYDESEMQGFDYIISSAGKHNIRLIMALGNTWTAYRSPEDFMRMAGVDPGSTDLLGFYQSSQVKSLYKDHMSHMVNRRNTLTGVAYKDDPTIMMWDVFNEPRCPGCTESWQQAAHQAWLKEMADTLKGLAPNQLVAAGTEGYFMDSSNEKWNPGAGAYCEGEDWTAINYIGSLDVTIAHVYDRQMEGVPPSWSNPTFDDLLNWVHQYLAAHVSASSSVGKPFVVEEFNVIFPKFNEAQRAQFFQLVYDALISSQQSGGALAGAMFWCGAIGSVVGDDGYNIYLDVAVPAPAAPSPAPGVSPSPQPVRQAIKANTETLDRFRRGPQRQQCAEARAASWAPAWTQSWARTVSSGDMASRTNGKSTQQIIKETGWRLG